MMVNYFIARMRNCERSEEPFGWGALGNARLKESFALLIPTVLVGSVMAALVAVIEDAVRFQRGTFEVAGGTGAGGADQAKPLAST
ncbi:MAG: hypothetical protein ACR2RB_18630 [Gammaproteobacteria bacterium]